MSNDDLFGAPAGWYPDPLGLPQLRWWNNHAWTEQTSAARQPMVVQDTKFAWADDEVPTRRDDRLRERSGDLHIPSTPVVPTAESLRELEPPRAFTQVSQGVPVVPTGATSLPTTPMAPTSAEPMMPAPMMAEATATRVESFYTPDPIIDVPTDGHSGPSLDTIFDVKPMAAPEETLNALFGESATRRAGTRVKTPIITIDHVAATATGASGKPSSTGPAWIIAMIPLFQIVLSLLLLTSIGMGGSQLIYIGILVVPYLIAIGLAYADYGILTRAGHEHPAHWRWAILTAPVYLLLRARSVIHETGHGIGPVLVWFGLGVMHLASLLAVPGVLIALLPAVFSAQIEDSVASDSFLITGTTMVVDCPLSPPVLPGETIVCEGVNASNNTFDITVTLERSNGWIAWQVVDWGSFKH